MNSLERVLLLTFLAGVGGTGLGGILGIVTGGNSGKKVGLLLGFAGGVMLGIVCFDLIREAIDLEYVQGDGNLWQTVLSILAGYNLVLFLEIALKRRRKNRPIGGDGGSQLLVSGLLMAGAIAIHNFPEGMAIGAYGDERLLMGIVIGIHNIPEGMAVGVPLCAGGMSRERAVLAAAVSGIPTMAGAAAGLLAGELGSEFLLFSLCFAGGAMLYVILGELLPESAALVDSRMSAASVLLGILLGLCIIYH